MGKPKIRFKGFDDDWEQRKLGDVLERRIEQRQQSKEYPRLAFASGQGVIPLSERKTNNREQLTKDEYTKKYLVTELNDIVYNPANVKYGAIDRNKCGRGLISPIYVTFTTSEISGFIERIVTSHDFQQRALRFEEGTVTKRQSVNPEDLVTLDILVASKREEQQKIATYFDSLDNLITLHQRKCDETKKLKKYMLQKMFPQSGQTVPEIRFSGFTDVWEQRKWMNSVDISTEMVDPASGEYDDMPHIAPGNIESFTGRILDNVRTVKEEQLISGKFRFRPDDVVYGKINPQLGKYFYASVDGLTSADAYVFKGKNGIRQKFLFSMLQTSDFFKYSVSVSKRSGMPKINRDELNAYAFLAPSEEEQDKIGNFLLEIDHLITLHQQKCDELRNIKKFMLQNMFA